LSIGGIDLLCEFETDHLDVESVDDDKSGGRKR